MGSVTVRRARPADVSAIYRVVRRSRERAFAGLLSPDALEWDTDVPTEYREWVESVIARDRMAQLVAVRDGTVVGCAEVVWHADETRAFIGEAEAELVMIHVSPDHWREGIGTRLVQHVVETPSSRLRGIALGVLADNDRARSFYDRNGFQQDGTTTATIAGEEYTEVVYRRRI